MIDFSRALAPISNFELYDKDVAYLKQYNDSSFKLVLMKSVRKAGYVERDGCKGKKNTAGNTSKLDSSISRSKARVHELGLCNDWKWFCTFTLSPEGHDRYDLGTFKKQFPKFINNINYNYGCEIKYLLIPEQHKDGAWHMHGLMKGIPDKWLTRFSATENVPADLVEKKYYNWALYAEKFGYVSFGRIKNLEGVSNYITKYITKDLLQTPVGLNKHLYLCSKGLKRAKTIVKGNVFHYFEPDFLNDYVAIKTFKSYDEAIKLFSGINHNSNPITFNMIDNKFNSMANFEEQDVCVSCISKNFESTFDKFLSKIENKALEVVAECIPCPQT